MEWSSTESVDDSDVEKRVRQQQQVRRGRKRTVDKDAQKMRAFIQQSMLSRMGDMPLAAAMLQSVMFVPQLMGNNAAAAQFLESLFAMAGATETATLSASGTGGPATSGTSAEAALRRLRQLNKRGCCAFGQFASGVVPAGADVLNLTKKASETTSSAATSSSPAPSTSSASAPFTSQ